ncbi:MAG: septum formation inhibitor Maf, partial [Deltaproteobacteria bacterium]
MQTVTLASSSPRRLALLRAAGYPVHPVPPDIDERWPGGAAEDAVKTLAWQKLRAVRSRPAVDPQALCLA